MTPREDPVGLPLVDALDTLSRVTLDHYISGVSEYVRMHHTIAAGPKKAAQVRLSGALGRALLADLRDRVPSLNGVAGERTVAGALRSAKADVSELHELDGLRLAVEIKPINLAVGRAIWNRFGDIRTFAVNLHLKFPFAVVGGVLTAPTKERDGHGQFFSTEHLIVRAVNRLTRAGGRRNEGEAPHLLEGVAVVAYDPESGTINAGVPSVGSGLRWPEFVATLAQAYDSRFGEGPLGEHGLVGPDPASDE